MKYLFSSHFSLLLKEDDNPSKKIFDGNCYGITWNKDKLYLATKDKIVEYENLNSAPRDVVCEDSKWVHQIYAHEDRLFIANTPKSRVDVFNIRENRMENKSFCESSDEFPNHINSIIVRDGLIYCCEHNKLHTPSRIRVFDENYNEVDLIDDVGKFCHNIYIHKEFVYVLNSGHGTIVCINRKNRERAVIRPEFPEKLSFFRGLAFDGEKFIMGATTRSELRKDRNHAVLAFLDKEFNYLYTSEERFDAQMHDIRIIDKMDLCHNEIPFPNGML